MSLVINSPPDTNLFPDFQPQQAGFKNTIGRTAVNPRTIASLPVIVFLGQSLYAAAAQGSFSPTQPTKNWNFNPYDGGVYPCASPMLGATWGLAQSPNGNNIPIQIMDALVANGDFPNGLIGANIAIGGTLAEQWATGTCADKIVTLMRLLKVKLNKVPKYISWHQGQSDFLPAGTSAASYAASVQAVKQLFDDNTDFGPTATMFVGLDTMLGNVTSDTIRSGQALAVSTASPLLKLEQGGDFDQFTGGTNRSDGTHPTAAGAIAMAAAEVAKIHAYHISHVENVFLTTEDELVLTTEAGDELLAQGF